MQVLANVGVHDHEEGILVEQSQYVGGVIIDGRAIQNYLVFKLGVLSFAFWLNEVALDEGEGLGFGLVLEVHGFEAVVERSIDEFIVAEEILLIALRLELRDEAGEEVKFVAAEVLLGDNEEEGLAKLGKHADFGFGGGGRFKLKKGVI